MGAYGGFPEAPQWWKDLSKYKIFNFFVLWLLVYSKTNGTDYLWSLIIAMIIYLLFNFLTLIFCERTFTLPEKTLEKEEKEEIEKEKEEEEEKEKEEEEEKEKEDGTDPIDLKRQSTDDDDSIEEEVEGSDRTNSTNNEEESDVTDRPQTNVDTEEEEKEEKEKEACIECMKKGLSDCSVECKFERDSVITSTVAPFTSTTPQGSFSSTSSTQGVESSSSTSSTQGVESSSSTSSTQGVESSSSTSSTQGVESSSSTSSTQGIPKCWTNLPSGCDNVLSEIKEDNTLNGQQEILKNGWFHDSSYTGNSKEECENGRKNAYNNYCSRNDAQTLWSPNMPTTSTVSGDYIDPKIGQETTSTLSGR